MASQTSLLRINTMSILRSLGILGLMAAKKALRTPTTLTWDELSAWIADISNPDAFGKRYSQHSFSARRPDGNFVIRREKRPGPKIRVTAAFVLGPRDQIVATKVWDVEAIDHKLSEKFGDNLRFNVKV